MKSLSNKMSFKQWSKRLKFKQQIPLKDGWCDWVYPKKDETFLFKCCDCGLVHELEFNSFIEGKRSRGIFEVIELPKVIRTMFRARRLSDLSIHFTKNK